jgi:hypothetical protein
MPFKPSKPSKPPMPSMLLANNECLLPILLEPAGARKASGRYNAWKPIANVIFETQNILQYGGIIALVLHSYSAFIPIPIFEFPNASDTSCTRRRLSRRLAFLAVLALFRPIFRPSHCLGSLISAPLLQTVQSVSVRHRERHR